MVPAFKNSRILFASILSEIRKLSAKQVLRALAGPLLLALALNWTPVRQVVDDQLSRRIEFTVRDWLGMGPKLDPRIKILAFDDQAFSIYGTGDLPASDWAYVFQLINKAGASAVFVDKIFSAKAGDLSEFAKRMTSISMPVHAGAFISRLSLPNRQSIDLNRPEFSIATYSGEKSGLSGYQPAATTEKEAIAYGPHESLAPFFSGIGHIGVIRAGRVQPLVDIDQEHIIPHLGLFAGTITLEAPRHIKVNTHEVYRDDNGEMQVNLSSPRDYHSHTDYIVNFIDAAKKRRDYAFIKPGDLVFVLPQMFTGNVDWKETPVGKIPGGYLVTSVANSALTGNWIREISGGFALSLLSILLGVGLAGLLSARWFWSVSVLTSAVACVVSLASFAYLSLTLPWLTCLSCLWVGGIGVYAERSRILEARGSMLRQALTGVVAPDLLDEILRDPKAHTYEPREQLVSIMFIDIANFSMTVESMPPRSAFLMVKAIMSGICETVHSYGGIVDRTLGDGLLCYFGVDLLGAPSENSADHANQAVLCAAKLQQKNLANTLAFIANSENKAGQLAEIQSSTSIPHGLRIGVNTATVFQGDLGDNRRIDMTIIGHGVNFAQRLEASCDLYHVMVSEATYHMLVNPQGLEQQSASKFQKKMMSIKNRSEPVSVFALNPFNGSTVEVDKALAVHQKHAGKKRRDERQEIRGNASVVLDSDFGKARLLDFSQSGFRLALGVFLSRGMVVNISMPTGLFNRGKASHDLLPESIVCEVRWSRVQGSEFIHGFSIRNLSSGQQILLEKAFREASQPLKVA